MHDALLSWGARVRRDLPWRRTRDPWAVLVSELMLQQTQVDRVVGPFEDFLDRFPDPSACADAPVAEVIRAWAGLGYNRRAVHLHRAAHTIALDHGGHVPDDLDALLDLPGVGPYTARAVRVFAFERPHGVVDTNAARFLSRAIAGRALTVREAQALADAQVPGDPWSWNQSVLDLGALVCRARPRCTDCPVASACAWAGAGHPEPDPAATTAGVSTRQSRFDGSDRQGRGRLLAGLRRAPVPRIALAVTAGFSDDPARARRVAESLVADGLARWDGEVLTLPER
jgi:A/G-specific adenine glycosylase